MSRRFLIVLAQDHFTFRLPEIESIASLLGFNLTDIWDLWYLNRGCPQGNRVDCQDVSNVQNNIYHSERCPYLVLKNIEKEHVEEIMSRTLFGRMAYEIWGHGKTYKELENSLKTYPNELKEPFFNSKLTFCLRVKACGHKVSLEEQVEKIDSLEDALPFQGTVNLKSPDNEFHVIEDYGPHTGKKRTSPPHYMYFGRLIATGQRSLLDEYSIKKRKFIGNTSMDAGLAFIMANCAKVDQGSYVCDPFVGTGSLLIAAARFGAVVTGGDINYNILHARGKSSRVGAGYREKDETVRHSLSEYGLGHLYGDVLLHDAARSPWRTFDSGSEHGIFDAIITDPPYGIRESCTRVGTRRPDVPDTTQFEQHYPEQTAYHLDDVFTDLLYFSAQTLIPGGRLVYWIPVYRPEYTDDVIPRHPSLRLVYNCEQKLKRQTSRRLIVMEKLSLEDCNHSSDVSIPDNKFSGHNSFRNKYFKLPKDL